MSEHNKSLPEAIADAAYQAFLKWRETHQSERLFAFALSTIDDALYVSASLNTDESHLRTLEKNGIQPGASNALYYKWGPWEWENEYFAPSQFENLDARLKAMYEKMHEAEFEEFRKQVFDAMIEALILLRAEFAKNPENCSVVLFATIYDSEEAGEMALRSAQAANPPGSISEFISSIGA